MPPIPPTLLSDISNRLGQGQTSREIAAAVGVSKSTVNNAFKALELDTPRSKGGRPSKLSDRDQRLAVRLITQNDVESAEQLTRVINRSRDDHVSSRTVQRALRKADMVARRPIKKPLLTAKHRQARLKWALEHQQWTTVDWMRVIWSDETKINRIGSDGHRVVWVSRSERLSDRRCQPTVKFGGGNVMVWGCMTWAGLGKIAKVEGRMNAQQYVSILDHLTPTIQACAILPEFPPQDHLIFQQDNDPKQGWL